jgi:hypothetical protein
MFEYYVTSIILIITLYVVYKKYFDKDYTSGEWLEVNKDINLKFHLEWDISANSNIKIANFSGWKKYFFGKDFFTSLKGDEIIVMDFKNDEDSDCILDVYDQKMRSIYHIVDPEFLVFSSSGHKNHYRLDNNNKYIFFLRNNFLDKGVKTILRKYNSIEKIKKKVKKEEGFLCSVDEENMGQEYVEKSSEVVDAMKNRGYILINMVSSEQYLSFPSNNIGNKLSLEVELGDVLILLCTNKEKTCGMINHTIEINSENNNLNWYPDDDENVSHLLLDNCDQEDIFTFYERTTNISKDSNILPFHVMVFKRGG